MKIELSLSDFRSPEQIALSKLKSSLPDSADWSVSYRKSDGDTYEVGGTVEQDEHFISFVGMSPFVESAFKSYLHAEIDALLQANEYYDNEVVFKSAKPEKLAVDRVVETDGNTVVVLTKDDILAMPDNTKFIMDRIRQSTLKDFIPALEKKRAELISDNRQFTKNRIIDVLFPKREAIRVEKKPEPSIGDWQQYFKKFQEIGITEQTYSQQIPAEIRGEHSTLALFCMRTNKSVLDGYLSKHNGNEN